MLSLRRAILGFLCCLGGSSCDDVTAPAFPDDQVIPMEPLEVYAPWWSLVEQCSERTGDLTTIRWYQTKGGAPLIVDGEEYDGYWFEQGNRIVIANPRYGPTVRHEMLHALLRRGDHPLSFFAGACDGVIRFDAPEGYGVPPALGEQAPTVAAGDALTIRIEPMPATPSVSQYDGDFTFTIVAENTSGEPVWVAIPDDYTGSYVWLEDGMAGTLMFTKAKRVFFDAGQSRRIMLDAGVDSAGTFHVRGGYARASSPWTPVVVSP